MKRMAQFAAILAIAFLMAQPAFASPACTFESAAGCVVDCPMDMQGMGPDCPMTGPIVSFGCPTDCCSHAAVQAMESIVAPEKLRVGAQQAVASDASEAPIAAPVADRPSGLAIRGSSPPRYLMNQVFRI